MTYKSLRALLVLPFLLLASCVNYEEHFTIDASGAGSIQATLLFKGKKAAASGEQLGEKLGSFLGKAPGLKLAHYSSVLTGKVRLTEFTIEFDQVNRLKSIGESEGAADVARFFGKFEVARLNDRYSVVRTVDLSDGFGSFHPAEQSEFGRKVTSALLSSYQFKYHMHFPARVLETNGIIGGEKNRSCSWSLPLSEIVAHPVAMSVDIQRPPVKLWIALATMGILLPAGAAGYWVKKRRRKA